jgi:hypothetical protein
MSKNIVIEDKGNHYFKLTVAKEEIRIKIQKGVSDKIKKSYIDKLLSVANKPELISCPNTLRGKTKYIEGDNYLNITMETENKKIQHEYLNV